jgi:hypothetical protein
MVRQLFSLLALAFTTISTVYAAPTARSPTCSVDPYLLLYVKNGASAEQQIEVTRTKEDHEGYVDYVWIVSR